MGEAIFYKSEEGLNLYAESYGDPNAETTVLCLHGLTRNHKDFEPLISQLPQHRHYVAVDVRGRGSSDRDPNPENYHLTKYVEDIRRLLDRLEPEKLVLIGTSMGGLMSMLLNAGNVPNLKGVVLNDIGPKLEQKGLDRIAGYVGSFKNHRSWQEAANAVEASQSAAFPMFGTDDWLDFAKRTHKSLEDGTIVLDYDPAIADSLKHIEASNEVEEQSWAIFELMQSVPLLIIQGGISDLISNATVEKMAKQHGNADIVTVENVGHAPILNEPECVAAIEKLIRSVEVD